MIVIPIESGVFLTESVPNTPTTAAGLAPQLCENYGNLRQVLSDIQKCTKMEGQHIDTKAPNVEIGHESSGHAVRPRSA